MRRIQQHCLRTATIIAGSALIALPAAAISFDEMVALCEEFMLNHLNEPEWAQACVNATEEWDSQRPPAAPAVQVPNLAPSGSFPIAQTAIAPGRHDGDRDRIFETLRSGASADVLVEFEVSEVRDEIHQRALEEGLRYLDADHLAEKRAAYASIKLAGLAGLVGVVVLRDYENLSTSFVRVLNEAALNSLIARPEVKAVYENTVYQHSLAESLPLIEQPAVAAVGLGGAGTTVAVLDTGVDFTIPPFNCTSPGIPQGCRVVATFEAAENDFVLDHNGHGTNVSAITASTAGEADLAVADVFGPGGASGSDIATAVDWAIAITPSFNIVAMNLSLGGPVRSTEPCPQAFLAAPLADALAAGIQPVASAGNGAFVNGVYSDGISAPACVPAAVSVGAVYDADVGLRTWSAPPLECTDATTAADQVTCFSQSAPILLLLAPGAMITATDDARGGTSFAAPHVAGAWSVMRAVSDLSEETLLETLQVIGNTITDARPSGGRTTSRLDLLPEPEQLLQLGAGLLALSGLRLRRSRRSRSR